MPIWEILLGPYQFWQCYGGPYNSISMSGARMAGTEGQVTRVKIPTLAQITKSLLIVFVFNLAVRLPDEQSF